MKFDLIYQPGKASHSEDLLKMVASESETKVDVSPPKGRKSRRSSRSRSSSCGRTSSTSSLVTSSLPRLLRFQMKAGDQKLTPALAVDELLKTSHECIGTIIKSFTFVFVCISGVSPQFFRSVEVSRQTKYAYHFSSGSTFTCERSCNECTKMDCAHVKPKLFCLPQGMEVLILKEDGLLLFLSERNLHSIRNFDFSILAAREAMSFGDRKRAKNQ